MHVAVCCSGGSRNLVVLSNHCPHVSSPFFVHSDLISVEGSIRVISDEFSISLLNPESEAYRFKEQKYSKMVNQ